MVCAFLLGLWLVVAGVGSLAPSLLVTPNGGLVPMTWRQALAGQLRDYGCWAPLTPAVVLATASARRRRWLARVLLHVALAATCAAVFSGLYAAATGTWGQGPRVALAHHAPRAALRYLVTAGGFLAVAAHLRAQRHALRAQVLESHLTQARLDALRVQLHPHFLFNTLHAIGSLVDERPAAARRMLTILGELLRLTLDRPAGRVPLREELAWLDRYLALQRVRFGDRLEVEVAVEPRALDAEVPALLLQPLVENALTHGADPDTGATAVQVAARVADDRLRLTVRDRGPGVRPDVTGGARAGGVGLRNTRERLEAAYGPRHVLIIQARPEGGAEVTVELPFERRETGQSRTERQREPTAAPPPARGAAPGGGVTARSA